MKFKHLFSIASFTLLGFSSCTDDQVEPQPQPDPEVTVEESSTFQYSFNNGQVVPTSVYDGAHPDNLAGKMMVEGLSNGKTRITVTLENSIDGETYMIHAHDAADPSTTPNGTPYQETPNSDVFTQMVKGNGGSVSAMQTTDMSYADITGNYEAFFVVHDPLQDLSTTDLTTYLLLGSFARDQGANSFKSMEFDYDFNTGQLVKEFAYDGSHTNNLSAKLKIQEVAGDMSRVSVTLMNTMSGETYMVHAHDVADPTSTPNGTPYLETPNSDVCTLMIMGNGSTNWRSQLSSMSYTELTSSYDAFFVVHDPLQTISTTDPTTYVILGPFAR
jgi:hypothetical protein